jgi:DNA-binding NarL/FixJ family response regulator
MPPDAATARTSSQKRVVIVDDHDLARAGLASLLSTDPRLHIVGEATTGREALALCRHLRPDLVLMDVRIPDLDGLAATRAIKQDCPDTSVIIVTMHENADYLVEALRAGAAGYVLKGATKQEFVSTVSRVLSGEPVINSDLTVRLLRRLIRADDVATAATQLTAREYDVLRLLVQGHTNGKIAHDLRISRSTVKAHVEHILDKLGVCDRTQAAVRAVELGLVASGPG